MSTRDHALPWPLAREAEPQPENSPIGPATPKATATRTPTGSFPSRRPAAGRARRRSGNTERRQPWVDVRRRRPDADRAALRALAGRPRGASSSACARRSPTTSASISIDHPALAHERDEIRYVYPHARSLVVHDRRGEQAVDAVALSADAPTTSSTSARSASFTGAHDALKYVKSLGGDGLTTTIGWPQEVSVRWAGQDLAAQPQARRAGRRPRRDRHQPQLPAPEVRRVLPHRHRRHQPRVHGRRVRRRSGAGLEPVPRVQPVRRLVSDRGDQRRRRVRFLRLLQPHLPRLDSRLPRPRARPRPRRSRSSFEKRWTRRRDRGALAVDGVPGRVPLLQLRRDLPGRDRATRSTTTATTRGALPDGDLEAADAHARARSRSSS